MTGFLRSALSAAALFTAALLGGSATIGLFPISGASAQSDAGLQNWLAGVRSQAIAAGVRPETFDRVAPALEYSPKTVSYDYAEPGNPNAPIPDFQPYRDKHVDAARINRGRAKYSQLRPLLSRIERETGVPEEIMVAIYGHETNYGGYTGNFDLLNSLASLAYAGRRPELFTGEFFAALKLLDRGVPRDRLKGSWAGATGYPQFLPSVWLTTAVDGNGDGDRNIWSDEVDALASIANYFVLAGWKPNVKWGVSAFVPDTLDRSALTNRTPSPRCPRTHARQSRWLTVAEWKRMGVVPTPGFADDELVTLIEPDGKGRTAYLLSSNYRAILDYNCSTFYALSVGLLADAVAG